MNDDPAGDDYDAQYNPTGTEGDHRYETGEHFDDFGLDGVPGTQAAARRRLEEAGRRLRRRRGRREVHRRRAASSASGIATRTPSRGAWSIPPGPRRRARRRRALAHRLLDRRRHCATSSTSASTRSTSSARFSARGRDVAVPDRLRAGAGPRSRAAQATTTEARRLRRSAGLVFQRYGHIDPSAERHRRRQRPARGHRQRGRIAARVGALLHRLALAAPQDLALQRRHERGRQPVPDCLEGSATITFPTVGHADRPVGPPRARSGISFPPGYCNARSAADPLPGHLPAPRLRPEAAGSRGDHRAAPELDERPGRQRRDARLPKAIIVYVDGRCRIARTATPSACAARSSRDSLRTDRRAGRAVVARADETTSTRRTARSPANRSTGRSNERSAFGREVVADHRAQGQPAEGSPALHRPTDLPATNPRNHACAGSCAWRSCQYCAHREALDLERRRHDREREHRCEARGRCARGA